MSRQSVTDQRTGKVRAAGVAAVLVAGGLVSAGMTVVTAGPAQAVVPVCVDTFSFSSDSACTAPGTLGSGRMVGIVVRVTGAGGGGGYNNGYSTGGGGATIDTSITVPEGSTLNVFVGAGGLSSDYVDNGDGAGGGGSSAIVLASGSKLLVEAGGGGGGTNLPDWDGGSGGGANGAGSASTAAGVCGGRGGNTDGLGTGGAAGSTTGSSGTVSCAGSQTASAGTAGGNTTAGVGGNGGSPNGPATGSGGAGYSSGGNGGKVSTQNSQRVYGGSGGGGGYGGGGGGTGSLSTLGSDDGASGSGGGGGSYALPAFTAGTAYSNANNGNYEGDGDNGRVYFFTGGPTVVTQQSVPTDVTGTSAVLHSLVNANGISPATTSISYSKDPAMVSGVSAAAVIPTSVTTADGDTNVTGTIASGLEPCTKYYYQAAAAGHVADPPVDVTTKGAVETFTTIGCTPPVVQLPLTVTAKSQRSKLPRAGTTVLVASAVTSSVGYVKTTVKCVPVLYTRGDLRYCTYRIGRNGKVTVKTFGYRGVKVSVTQRAWPIPGNTSTPSNKWSRTWSVK
ncbi:MAG: hypothetical protein WCI74_01370 [Actinomycetes bacterium]